MRAANYFMILMMFQGNFQGAPKLIVDVLHLKKCHQDVSVAMAFFDETIVMALIKKIHKETMHVC